MRYQDSKLYNRHSINKKQRKKQDAVSRIELKVNVPTNIRDMGQRCSAYYLFFSAEAVAPSGHWPSDLL